MPSPFYGCVFNGVALAAVSVLGLLKPVLTEHLLNAVIGLTPLQALPPDLSQGWVSAKQRQSSARSSLRPSVLYARSPACS